MHTKITRLPFPTSKRSSKIIELVHSNVCDLHATPTIGGKKYFATFIDDYSRYCYVYLLHSKDEVLEKFRIYKSEVELKCDTRIKCLRTDRGGEYYDPRYFQSTGIVHQVTAPYTPQQNGIAERKNRTLMDMVNSMMSYSGLSSGYWGEALLTACYILNRVPSKRSIKTELWNQRTPKLDYLRIWGCRAIVRLPESKKRKLGDKGIECIFLGYAQNSKAYRFIVVEPNDLISVNTIIESRDARFDENRFKTIPKAHEISKETVSTKIPITTEGNNDDSFPDRQQVEPRRSTRQRRQRTFSPDFEMYLVEGDRKGLIREYPIIYNLDEDPQTYSEAMKSHDSSFWKEVVNDEMDSIIGNNTWILVDLPPGSKAIKRPDIAYVVGRLSRHTSNHGKEHWDAVNRVFKYLKKTMDYGLEYSGDSSVLEGYTDASWITDQEDYVSTSGWIFTLGGGAVSWGSKKQSCLTDSTMAAEFVALA
ncbi:zinc finger, CCHC-type containing protein, partial [Tanacetum coccineum]